MNKGIGSVSATSTTISWNSSTRINTPSTITPTIRTADSDQAPTHSSPIGDKEDRSSFYSTLASTHHDPITISSDAIFALVT